MRLLIKICRVLIILIIISNLIGCNLSYFIPPKESILEFTINNYYGKWTSNGAEGVADKRYIQFSPKILPKEFKADNVVIWFTEPVKPKLYSQEDSEIEFRSSITNKTVFNTKNPLTRININLKNWSNKPRGLIEGDIEGIFYDYNGLPFKMNGHFKAYQALGTINSFH